MRQPTVTPGETIHEGSRPAIAQWHRGFALLAVVSLFIGTRTLWTEALRESPALALVITGCYAAILAAAVLVATVSSPRTMSVVEAAILGTAIVLLGCLFVLHHGVNDVGALIVRAADAILHGTPVYGVHWPDVFEDAGVAATKTMDGGLVDTYPYPPLAALFTALVRTVVRGYVAAPVVTMVALVIGAIVLWLLLPAPWRSAATAITLGFGLLPFYAHRGYPAIIAVAFLVPVAVGWTSIGRGGRLGRRDIVRGICLGGACAAQQLAWFLVPFLLAGLWSIRRSELAPRQGAKVLGAFFGIAVVVFLIIDLPFVVTTPAPWLEGILSPIVQHAVPHGQGIVGISYYLLDGSSGLAFFGYGALLLGLGLLALSVLFMRRIGPAIWVLPWMIFYLATRSQDGYFLLMTPLWLASVATVAPADFATAWQPRAGWLGDRRFRIALVPVLLLPAVACIAIAIASPPPLRMEILGTTVVDARGSVSEIEVRVTNAGPSELRPHFAVSSGQSMSAYWRQLDGPDTLAPGQTADFRLETSASAARPGEGGYFRLRAVSDEPMTISSTTIPVGTPSTPIATPSPEPAP